MTAYRGSICMATLILNLCTRWRWVANFTPQLLAGRGEGGLGGPPHSRSGLQKTEKYIAPAPNRTPDRLSRSLILVLITLSMWYTNAKVLVGKVNLHNANGLHTLSEVYRHFRQSFLYLWSVVSHQWVIDNQNIRIRSAVITILSVKDRHILWKSQRGWCFIDGE